MVKTCNFLAVDGTVLINRAVLWFFGFFFFFSLFSILSCFGVYISALVLFVFSLTDIIILILFLALVFSIQCIEQGISSKSSESSRQAET